MSDARGSPRILLNAMAWNSFWRATAHIILLMKLPPLLKNTKEYADAKDHSIDTLLPLAPLHGNLGILGLYVWSPLNHLCSRQIKTSLCVLLSYIHSPAADSGMLQHRTSEPWATGSQQITAIPVEKGFQPKQHSLGEL